jgi:hypothetical protein
MSLEATLVAKMARINNIPLCQKLTSVVVGMLLAVVFRFWCEHWVTMYVKQCDYLKHYLCMAT